MATFSRYLEMTVTNQKCIQEEEEEEEEQIILSSSPLKKN
jgi:hypothetical protein